ncbi:hypothetical protein DNTS_020419 [Danionella cerebrum]|uniref:Major facilitator superfamily (MFS) profile domain-containing protein n=1 Tax=Danionella cerebrum TaxID=2873325 RepID=A0A553QMA9_9TELE|nr:hypothetical protein DNTS_020419 [Danionella translucida]
MEEETGETEALIQSSSADSRPQPLGAPPARYKVYRKRWFILAVLSLLNCSNAMCWLSFAPVADETAQTLHLSLQQVNWFSLVYVLVAIVFSFCSMWILDTKGLRFSLLLGALLNACGSALRVVSMFFPCCVFPLMMCGQILCALAQPLIVFAPAKLAAQWFPEHQRATANTLASMANPLGLLLANVVSPLVISHGYSLFTLMCMYAGPTSVACALALLGICESLPAIPPSASRATPSDTPSIKQLLQNRAYLILLLCFGSGIGIFTCFSTLLQQILCVQGYTNEFAGLCGAVSVVLGLLGALVLGVCVDRTKAFTEVTKIGMSMASLGCTAFSMVSQLANQRILVAVVCGSFGLFGYSVYPIAMELAVECTYPTGEATSTGLIFLSGVSAGDGRFVCSGGLHLRSILPHGVSETASGGRRERGGNMC